MADLGAVVRAVGAPAFVHGISSGGALALLAAAEDIAIAGVSATEPPYRVPGPRTAPERVGRRQHGPADVLARVHVPVLALVPMAFLRQYY